MPIVSGIEITEISKPVARDAFNSGYLVFGEFCFPFIISIFKFRQPAQQIVGEFQSDPVPYRAHDSGGIPGELLVSDFHVISAVFPALGRGVENRLVPHIRKLL